MALEKWGLRVSLDRKVTRGSWEEVIPETGKSECGNPEAGLKQIQGAGVGHVGGEAGRKAGRSPAKPGWLSGQSLSLPVSKSYSCSSG